MTFQTCKARWSCLVQESCRKSILVNSERPATSFMWRRSEVASWGKSQLTSSSKLWTSGWRERRSGQGGPHSQVAELGVGSNTARSRRSLACGSRAGEVAGVSPKSPGGQGGRRSVCWRQQGGRGPFGHKNDRISAVSARRILHWVQSGQKAKRHVGPTWCMDSGGEDLKTHFPLLGRFPVPSTGPMYFRHLSTKTSPAEM